MLPRQNDRCVARSDNVCSKQEQFESDAGDGDSTEVLITIKAADLWGTRSTHSPAFELSGLQVISDSFGRAPKLVAEDDLTAQRGQGSFHLEGSDMSVRRQCVPCRPERAWS